MSAIPSASLRVCALSALVLSAFAGAAHAQITRTVNVQFNWTDRLGTLHPLGYAWASGSYSALPILPSNDAGSFYLPSTGVGSWTGSTIIPLVDTLSFSGNVESRFGAGGTEWFRVVNNAGNTYNIAWGPIAASTTPPPGDSANLFCDNDTYAGTAMGIGQFFAFGRNYAVNRLGVNMPAFRVQYDAGYAGASNYNGSLVNPIIQLNTTGGWASSDVMLHELGHYVAARAGIDASPGGDHTFGGDNITGDGRGAPGLGAIQGSRLAWSEGFATYFGLSAVRAGNLQGAIPNLSNDDYDNEYARYVSAGSRALDYTHLDFTVSAETPIGRNGNGTNTPTNTTVNRRGEGSEGSVLWALWDMFDDNNGAFNHPSYGPANPHLLNDRVTYGDVDMWNRLITPNNPTSFRLFWNNVTADCNTNAGRAHISGLATNTRAEAVAAVGEILEAAGISGVPTTGAAAHVYNTPRPDLTWLEGNYSNSAFFQILIYANDWSSLIYRSGVLNDNDPNSIDFFHYTIDQDLANGNYWWVIQNSPAGIALADVTGAGNIYNWYWSGARPITVTPTPGAIALLAFGGLVGGRRRR
jgi:MYXO-CTERM domain-containing protein